VSKWNPDDIRDPWNEPDCDWDAPGETFCCDRCGQGVPDIAAVHEVIDDGHGRRQERVWCADCALRAELAAEAA